MITYTEKKNGERVYDAMAYDHIEYPQYFMNGFVFVGGYIMLDDFEYRKNPVISPENRERMAQLGLTEADILSVERKLRFGRKNGIYTMDDYKQLPLDTSMCVKK